MLRSLVFDISDWCRGKNWLWRLPVLIFFSYVFIRHVLDPEYTSIFGALNLGVHELGHLVFAFFGDFLCAAGGTIAQLLIPVIGAVNFYRQKDYFGISFAFGWLSTSFFESARYIGDARAMDLPLVTFFWADDAQHDWNYLLSRMGILQLDTGIAFAVKILAVISMCMCFFLGITIIALMIKSKDSR
ncbi:MAG: hypothetical protein WC335_01460 [Candidatus Omnitrophota bacterium]|jgi:hypothetical protein